MDYGMDALFNLLDISFLLYNCVWLGSSNRIHATLFWTYVSCHKHYVSKKKLNSSFSKSCKKLIFAKKWNYLLCLDCCL